MRGRRTVTTYWIGPTQLEQPERTQRDRHGPTHPTAGQAGHWAAQTMTYQPQYCQQHHNHTRGRSNPGTPRNDIPDGEQKTQGQLQRPNTAGPAHTGHHTTQAGRPLVNQHHAPDTPRSRHIHRTGHAGRRNPQNKPGRQRKTPLTTSARATQPATDQTAAEQRADNEQTTHKPANTPPARHARVETGTASHGLATTCCATPANDHTHEHNRTPQLYHREPDQPTLTNYTTLHLDIRRGN